MEPHSRLFWVNFLSLCSVLALSEASRGIVTPVLSLYVTTLGGSAFFLSLVVAVFSVGRLVASMVLGVLSDRLSVRWIMVSALVITLIGHILYLVSETGGLWVLVIGRVFAGFGTAILSAARAYVSTNTSISERTQFMAWLGIVQFAGFAFTPILGGFPVNITIGSGWVIDSFTAGTYIVMLLDALLLPIIWFALKQEAGQVGAKPLPLTLPLPAASIPEQLQLSSEEENEETASPHSPPSPSPIPAPQAQSEADSLSSAPVNSTLLAASGTVVDQPAEYVMTVTEPAAPTPTRRRSSVPAILVPIRVLPQSEAIAALRDLQPQSPTDTLFTPVLFILLNATSRGCLAIAETFGALLYYQVQYGQQYDPRQVNTVTESLFMTMLGGIGVLVFMTMHRFTHYVSELTQLVCGFMALTLGFVTVLDFDNDLKLGNLTFSMALIYCVATPLNNTLLSSMLSKQLPKGSHGYWMGLLTAAGSVGRIVFPLMSGALYSAYSTNAALLIPVIVALLSVLSVLIGLKAYRPWYDYWREIERRMVRWVHNQHRPWRSEYDPARIICDDIDDEEIEDAWMTAEEIVERSKRKAARKKSRGLFRGRRHRRHVDCVSAPHAVTEAELMVLSPQLHDSECGWYSGVDPPPDSENVHDDDDDKADTAQSHDDIVQ